MLARPTRQHFGDWRIADSSSKNAVSFFIGMHNETLSVVAVCVCNPDRSPVGINR
jgi:hypothetical protein